MADVTAPELPTFKGKAGWEFTDLGGRHHAGGGSHGSLVAGDSTVPVLTIGMDADIRSITDVTPAVRTFFGVDVTADAR